MDRDLVSTRSTGIETGSMRSLVKRLCVASRAVGEASRLGPWLVPSVGAIGVVGTDVEFTPEDVRRLERELLIERSPPFEVPASALALLSALAASLGELEGVSVC